jgi:hypothetical protein
MTDRDVMRQALDLLNRYSERDDIVHLAGIVDVLEALRAALAQPEVGPVVWRCGYESYLKKGEIEWVGYAPDRVSRTNNFDGIVWQPLYGGKVEKQK